MQALREVLFWLKRELEDIDPDSAYLEAELLISYVLNKDRSFIYTVDFIEEEKVKEIKKLLGLRKKGIPISYILKKKFFYDYEFFTDKGVLIPRNETELLVDVTIDTIKSYSSKKIVDIGVGSGNLAVTLAKKIDNLTVYACDISPFALKFAKINAQKYGVIDKIKFFLGPYLHPIIMRNLQFDLILSNPPYIASWEMPFLQKEVKREPWESLYGGWNGCVFYENIIKDLKKMDKGVFIFEISPFIYDNLVKLIKRTFLKFEFHVYKDLSQKNRVIKLIWWK
uniref:peptide chain release factor N(5)-glutamine methyltransferase n=1 Tax=Dictyoglomus thermophilum TaxID=14 RepID=A0A7C3ML14_DICTH